MYASSKWYTSVLAYAMSQKPTFFSLWIGNNDVLGSTTVEMEQIQLHLLQVAGWF
jgi:hypothetical protein